MMNKYYVELGEIGMDRIVEYYIAYSSKTPEELEDDMSFLSAVDDEINEMYYNYGEEDEDFEDFQDSMGIRCIETYSEDEHGKDDYPILFDERN